MFWALMFPIVLGTFFYFSFRKRGHGGGYGGDTGRSCPGGRRPRFMTFLDEMDGDILKVSEDDGGIGRRLLLKAEKLQVFSMQVILFL